MLPLVLADFMDGDDVLMLKIGRRLGFGMKPLNIFFGGQLSKQDHFQGDGSVERHLPGSEDHTHAATANLLQQFVVAEHHSGLDNSHWRSHTVEAFIGPHIFSQFRILREEFLFVQWAAGFRGLNIGRKRFIQMLCGRPRL